MALARWGDNVAIAGAAADANVFSVTDVGEGAIVSEPPADLERGTVLAARYQVETFVGKGGSGVVLRAFDRITQTPVALKILNSELATDPRWVERFGRELRLGRQIQHPNVCRVFDIGESDGHRFLSMELATGGTLRESVRADAPPRPLGERVSDARALVSGLAALHAAGIIHRDVKPENLLRMEDGRVVLSDFGLATNPLQAPAVTVMVGTPSYMAPEIVMGDPATFRSDVWALGVTMHEILFGKRPEWDIVDGQRVLARSAAPGETKIERALAELCAACSGERIDTRPVDATEVLAQFQAIEQGRAWAPVRSPGLTSLRRRRLGWAALSLAGLVGLLASQRLWNTATAGTTMPDRARRIASVTGEAQDWSKASRRLAGIDGKVHCMSLVDRDRHLRLIWGAPRVAEEINLATGARRAADLVPETFASGCPQASPVAADLLFEKFDENGRRHIFLSPSGDGASARPVTVGSEPLWLRNGNEFAYSVDDAHAAIFSLPVMASTIVSDGRAGARLLVGKFVSADGSVLALRYFEPSFEKTIVVHRLPALEVVDRITLPKGFKEAAFGRSADDLLLSYEEDGNVILGGISGSSSSASRLAIIPGYQLRNAVPVNEKVAFLASKIISDVWSLRDGHPVRQLTSDGTSYRPDVSARGELLVESLQPQGDLRIKMVRAGGGPPIMLTAGPVDLTPSFLPGDKGWLYVRADRRSIMRCAPGSNDCQELYTSEAVPLYPVGSPDGKAVAFLSAVSRSRVFVWTEGASARDLVPARLDCAPRWSSSDRLWVLQGADDRAQWVEVWAASGRATGQTAPAGEAAAVDYGCPYTKFPPVAGRTAEVAAVAVEPSEVRIH